MKDIGASRYGVTAIEYAALSSVWFIGGGVYNHPRFIRHILFVQSALAAAQLSPIATGRAWTAAGKALDACLTKGWIKTLTPEDCRFDEARWAKEPNRAFDEDEYEPGNIDFTEEGAQLWNRIRSEEAEAGGEREGSGIRYAWRFAGKVRVFSAYEDELKTWVEAILRVCKETTSRLQRSAFTLDREVKDLQTLSGKAGPLHTEPYQIVCVEGPFALGEWWIDRFTRLPQGYYMDIYLTFDAEE